MRSLLWRVYVCHASMICLELFRHMMPCALIFALLNAGSSNAARMAIIAMTTSSSIKVKAGRSRTRRQSGIIVLLGRSEFSIIGFDLSVMLFAFFDARRIGLCLGSVKV